MKKILKVLSLLLVCCLTLVGACGCRNSVSDMRRRERQLRERQRQEERRIAEEETTREDEPVPEKGAEPERNKPERDDGEKRNPLFPDHGKLDPRFQRPAKPNPVPFPMPKD